MHLYHAWLEDASTVDAVETVFYQGRAAADVGQFLAGFFEVWQLFSELVLQLAHFLAVAHFADFSLSLPFFLLFFLFSNMFLDLFLFLFELPCYFLMTVGFVQSLSC